MYFWATQYMILGQHFVLGTEDMYWSTKKYYPFLHTQRLHPAHGLNVLGRQLVSGWEERITLDQDSETMGRA